MLPVGLELGGGRQDGAQGAGQTQCQPGCVHRQLLSPVRGDRAAPTGGVVNRAELERAQGVGGVAAGLSEQGAKCVLFGVGAGIGTLASDVVGHAEPQVDRCDHVIAYTPRADVIVADGQ